MSKNANAALLLALRDVHRLLGADLRALSSDARRARSVAARSALDARISKVERWRGCVAIALHAVETNYVVQRSGEILALNTAAAVLKSRGFLAVVPALANYGMSAFRLEL